MPSLEDRASDVAAPASAPLSAKETEARAGALLLLQLQLVFVWLRQGTVRAYDPSAFVNACSCLGLEYPVLHQNDAAEFLDKLVAGLEKRVKGMPAVSAPRRPHVSSPHSPRVPPGRRAAFAVFRCLSSSPSPPPLSTHASLFPRLLCQSPCGDPCLVFLRPLVVCRSQCCVSLCCMLR
jgi:hypothetical protein